MLQNFLGKNENNKELQLDTIKDNINFSLGMMLKKEKLKDGISINFLEPLTPSINAQKVFAVGNGVFVFATDKNIYKIENNKREIFSKEKCNDVYSLIAVPSNLYADYLLATDKGIKFIGEDERFISEKQSFGHIFFKNILFCYNKKSLIFYNRFSDSNIDEYIGRIDVGATDGDIISLKIIDDYLYVFTSNTIYKLSAVEYQSEFSLEKVVSTSNSIVKDSICVLGDRCFFVSNVGAYSLKNDSLTKINTLLDNFDFTVTKNCGKDGEKYILPVKINGTNYLYVYDTNLDSDCFLTDNDYLLSDSGFIVSKTMAKIGNIVCGENTNSEFRFTTGEIDFDCESEKVLTAIYVSTLSNIKIEISGDFGTRTIRIKAGQHTRSIRLVSKRFTINLTSYGNIKIENLKIFYRIGG